MKHSSALRRIILTIGLAFALSSRVWADYASTIQSYNPAGYWPLNETAPTPQAEVATNLGTLGAAANAYYLGTNATINAVNHTIPGALTDGDQAAMFNGGFSCSMAIPRNNSGLVINPPFSVECWVYQTNSSSLLGLVAGGRNSDLASSVYSGWNLETAASGAVAFKTYNRNSTTAALTITSPTQTLNAWHHVVATYSFDSTAILYVDGVQVGSSTNAYFPSYAPEIQIASQGGLDVSRFAGSLDEIAIYTNALSVSDVVTHYASGTSGSPVYKDTVLAQKPIIYLRLDEPTFTAPLPSAYAVATNYGTVGATANGAYQPGTTPGVAGPPFSGFGAANYACAFNGLNALVDCGKPAGLLPSGSGTNAPISVLAWFKTSPADFRFQSILGRGDSAWRIGLNANLANGSLGWNPGFGTELNPTAFNVNDGRWHCVVGTLNTTNGKVIYLDGVPIGTNSGAGTYTAVVTNLVIGGAPDYISARGLGSTRYFAGTIAQVAYFTNALTATDVSNIFNAAGISITTHPVSQAVVQGNSFTLSVAARGPGVLGYQWYRGATPVGTGGSTLTVSGAAPADAGNYTVVVTNATDSITSAGAVVAVIPTAPPSSAYASALLALNPVGYWPLTESSGSAFALNYGSLGAVASGIYQYGSALGVAGPNYVGLGGATTACQFHSWGGFVDLGASDGLRPTNRQPMTFVAWFQGPNDARFQGLAGHGDSFWRSSTDASSLNHFNPGNGAEMTGTLNLKDGRWHQLAGVSDGTNEWLYLDGVLNVTNIAAAISTNAPALTQARAVIGGAPDYGATPSYPVFATSIRFWNGNIAQVAFFTNALASTTISNLYGAAGVPPSITQQPGSFTNAAGINSTLAVAAGGSALVYQWYKGPLGSGTPLGNGGNISGATAATLTFSPLGAGDTGTYYVILTNNYGAVTSTLATIGVYSAPASSYSATVLGLSPSPVAYWPLNETTPPPAPYYATNLGTLGASMYGLYETWWQPSGNGFNLSNSIQHITGATGDGDQAAVFGNNGQYVMLPHNNPSSVIKAPFSVEAWVQVTNTPSGAIGVISQSRNNILGNPSWAGFWLGCSNTTWIFALYNTNGQISQEIAITNQMPLNAWTHLVGTFDGTTAALYVNNSLPIGATSANPRTLSPNAAGLRFVADDNSPFLVGALGNFNNGRFPGYIDDVSVYTNALSGTDVANHYLSQFGDYVGAVQANKPIVYLRLNEPAYVLPAATMAAAVGVFPVATNYGTVGLVASGLYQPGTVPGVQGPAYPGFGASSYGVAINGLAGIDVGGGNLSGNMPLLNRAGLIPLSIVAWFKGTADAGRFQNILGHSDASWRLAVDASSFNRFNSGGGAELTGTNRAVGDGQWHMVAGVATGSTVTLYIDGVPHISGTQSSMTGSALDVILGGDPQYMTPGTRLFLGSISQVAYFTNALTLAQVQQLYSAAGIPPYFIQQPQNVIANAGAGATNTVVVNGSQPFGYQWYKGTPGSGTALSNVGNVSGATTNVLILNPLAGNGSDSGTYFVIVTNSYGAVTSSIVTLTVNTAPVIVQQPPSFNLFAGNSCTFNVTASGAVPLYYYWKSNNVFIAGATNTSLTLTNVQLSYGANYSCLASNFLGTTNSSNGVLTVLTTTQPYVQTVLNDRPIDYWRLGEASGSVAYDVIGANNGQYFNVLLGVPGVNGGDPDTAVQFGPSQGSYMGNVPTNVNFATPNGASATFSVECWAKGPAQSFDAGIITKGGGGGGEQLNLDTGGTSHGYRFFVRNAVGTSFLASSATVPDGNWHHLVGVCSQTNSSLSLYVDGVLVASAAPTAGSGILASATPLSVGARQSGSGSPYDLQFNGVIDEVAIYNYPLSQAQVQAHFAAKQTAPFFTQQPPASQIHWLGAPLTISAAAGGTPTLGYQWFKGTPGSAVAMSDGANISGSGTRSLVINSVGVSDAANYFVVVTNSFASATSIVASVTGIAAPSGAYVQAVIADKPLAYLRLGETNDPANFGNNGSTAFDYWGGHDGLYTNADLQQPGALIGDSDTAGMFGTISGQNSYVGAIQGIDFAATNVNANFSVETWVKGGAVQTAGAGLVSKGYSGSEQFCLDYSGTSPVGWRFFVRSADSGIPSHAVSSGMSADDRWHHLVGVCDGSNNAVRLYVDGIQRGQTSIAATPVGILSTAYPVIIGSRQSVANGTFDYQFAGTLDEVVMYNTALSSNQVLNHYYAAGAAPALTIAPTNTTVSEGGAAIFYSEAYGTPALGYQWYASDGANPTAALTGKTSANLTLAAVSMAQNSTYYQVVATNAYGAVTSAPAMLTVVTGPPQIQVDLQPSYIGLAGSPITLAATFAGTLPFSYGWYYNGGPLSDGGRISGAHSNALTIANTQLSDTGTYQLFVTNAPGTGNSLAATLNVVSKVGFNTNGLGWALNGGALIGTDVLTLTDGLGNEARSSFFAFPLYIGAFKASFTYQDVGGGGADGATFVLQNDPRGALALGGNGGQLGYGTPAPITPSAALEMNIYSANIVGIAFRFNGTAGTPYTSTTPVNIAGGNPIAVSLVYLNGVVSLTLTDTVTASTYTTSYAAGSLPSVVGGQSAYVGFTGGTGAVVSTQTISNFSFTPLPALAVQAVGNSLVITWPANVGGYVLKSSASLDAPNWQDVNAAVNVVNGQNQVTLSPLAGTQFYRLVLP